jgi:hypothetical protein
MNNKPMALNGQKPLMCLSNPRIYSHTQDVFQSYYYMLATGNATGDY